jgi:dihydroorotate dehydrogenase (NAD+) catalytic subunit
MNLKINFSGVTFKNPIVLASGILGVTGSSLAETIRNGCGGVTTKSIWLKEHLGHPNPVIIANEEWMMNAVGLPDGGVEKAHEEINSYREKTTAPLIASIVGGKISEYISIAEKIVDLSPDIIEVNASCPNVEDELGKPFACSVNRISDLTKAVKKVSKNIPVSIKLSPNVENIGEIAKSCQNAGADALTVVNTFGPGLAIDINVRKPILANKVGGVSGPGIFPLALKCVWDCYKATKLPIIGTGGITTGEDALQMIMAGANLLGVGSAVYYRGNDVFKKINDEIEGYMAKNGIENLSDLIGVAHS